MMRCAASLGKTWAVLLLAVLLSVGGSMPAASQAKPSVPSIDPLVAVLDADPLELARVAQRLGDLAVIARLGVTVSTEVRLAAIRAAPYLRLPEQALGPLSLLIASRDTLLAQEAARSVLAIVRAVDRDQLQRHEVMPHELSPVRKELERIAAIEHLRADLRAMANAAAGMLAGLGVTSGA